jgi:hypothetical protein
MTNELKELVENQIEAKKKQELARIRKNRKTTKCR